MPIKVLKTKNWVSDGVTTSELDFLSDVVATQKVKNKIKRDVGDLLVEHTLDALSSATTPVAGAPFQKTLSKEYKKRKSDAGLGSKANLEFSGSMTENITYKQTDTGIEIGVFKNKDAAKADGHNNFSGQSKLPQRKFLPQEGDQYKPNIKQQIDDIIFEHIALDTNIPKQELKSVEDSADFWSVMQTAFGELSKPDIRRAVTQNPMWIDFLSANGLLRFLGTK